MPDDATPLAKAIAENWERFQESLLTYQEMAHASDRICAIVTAAWLEEKLQYAITWRLGFDRPYVKKCFSVDGFLGSFEAKVSFGYLVGIFGSEARENLVAIGRIRNRFAHRTHIRSFAHKELDPFFKKLTIYKHLKAIHDDPPRHPFARLPFPDALPDNAKQRSRFVASVQTLEGYLLFDIFKHTPIAPHDPRF